MIFGRLRSGGDGRRLHPEPTEHAAGDEGGGGETGHGAAADPPAGAGRDATTDPSADVGPGAAADLTADVIRASEGAGAAPLEVPAGPIQESRAPPLDASKTAASEAAFLAPTGGAGPPSAPEAPTPPAPPPQTVPASTPAAADAADGAYPTVERAPPPSPDPAGGPPPPPWAPPPSGPRLPVGATEVAPEVRADAADDPGSGGGTSSTAPPAEPPGVATGLASTAAGPTPTSGPSSAPGPPGWIGTGREPGGADSPARGSPERAATPGGGRDAPVTADPVVANPASGTAGVPASGHLPAPGIPAAASVPPAPTPVAGVTAAASENGDSHGDSHPDPAPLADLERPRPHPAVLAHPLPRRFAIANQKGGVGKTTTAVNLGAALAELEFRVLVVDLDPQGNATTGLGINARNLDASIYDVILHDVPIEDVIEPTTLRNLFVVPATIDLAGAEIELVPVFSRELRLRRALQAIEADFDFVLIDCPPSLGLLTVNGLAAASEVVVPIQCEYYALEGLGQLLRNVGLVQSNLNTGLEVSTIILTMYDARTRLAEQVVEEVRRHFGDRVCRNVVPRTVRLSEAPSFGQPIIVFDPSSRGAIAYRELAKEVSGGAPQRVR